MITLINKQWSDFDWFKIWLCFPYFNKGRLPLDVYSCETNEYVLSLNTIIKFTKCDYFWNFSFLILGFGIKIARQNGY